MVGMGNDDIGTVGNVCYKQYPDVDAILSQTRRASSMVRCGSIDGVVAKCFHTSALVVISWESERWIH